MDGEQAQALRNRKRARSLKLLVPAGVIAVFLVVALFPEWFARYSYSQMHPSRRLEGPSADFWFGTDSFGRDTYTRVIVGTRISNGVAAGAVVVAVVGGVVLGVAGGLSRTFGFLLMRLVDVVICFPPIIVAIFFMAMAKPGVPTLTLVIGFLYAPRMARIVQSAVLEVSQATYVEAQRALGARILRIARKGILPQILAPIVVQATVMLATAILLEAGLSFLGLGIPPPTPTWGQLVSDARRTLHLSLYLLLFPGLALSANVIFINLLGDGLRDLLDPKLRRSG
ncbi:MAG TPA: ABC transporter permease [Candidatus Methylomirabilis sp.]|nr:ABC transporter permease [Candidatus Methylomirabilis sp.]